MMTVRERGAERIMGMSNAGVKLLLNKYRSLAV